MDKRFTAQEKHDAAAREVKFRERLYWRLIENAKMSRQQADKQIAIMEEIAADYAELLNSEKLI